MTDQYGNTVDKEIVVPTYQQGYEAGVQAERARVRRLVAREFDLPMPAQPEARLAEIATSVAQADGVVAFCGAMGISLLPWQEATLRAVLRGEGYLAPRRGGW